VIGLGVEGDQDIDAVALGADGLAADADLVPGVAALDLGRIGAEGEDMEAGARRALDEHIAGADDAFAALPSQPHDDLTATQIEPPHHAVAWLFRKSTAHPGVEPGRRGRAIGGFRGPLSRVSGAIRL